MVAQVLAFSQPNIGGAEVLAADAARIWPYTAPLGWPSEFTALTAEETVADVNMQVRDGSGRILSVRMGSTQE
jgi:hypothetical protein